MNLASSPRPCNFVRHFSKSLFVSLIFIIISSVGVQAETYKVIRVYDGDTITIVKGGKKQSIRLVGIDTPEKSRKKGLPGQPGSPLWGPPCAGHFCWQAVSIEAYGTDRYKRILGVVYVNQTNVNRELVKNGYAEVYRGKPAKGFDSDPYWQDEAQAKSKNLNIWSLGENYMSPREWRRRNR